MINEIFTEINRSEKNIDMIYENIYCRKYSDLE